jgi:hypothetical protein
LSAVAGLTDDVETGAFEKAGQALAEQHVVLGHDHACRSHHFVIFRRGCIARFISNVNSVHQWLRNDRTVTMPIGPGQHHRGVAHHQAIYRWQVCAQCGWQAV